MKMNYVEMCGTVSDLTRYIKYSVKSHTRQFAQMKKKNNMYSLNESPDEKEKEQLEELVQDCASSLS